MNYFYTIKINILCIQQISVENSQNRTKRESHSTRKPGERVSYHKTDCAFRQTDTHFGMHFY